MVNHITVITDIVMNSAIMIVIFTAVFFVMSLFHRVEIDVLLWAVKELLNSVHVEIYSNCIQAWLT